VVQDRESSPAELSVLTTMLRRQQQFAMTQRGITIIYTQYSVLQYCLICIADNTDRY